jgi:hypothetical protein
MPWFSLCVLTGGALVLTPLWALLEGSGQVNRVYKFRFVQGIVANISTWIAISGGAELWAASVASVATLGLSAIFLTRHYRTYFATLMMRKPDGPRVNWHTEIFPMQWRIAVSWISGYFILSLFVPIAFKYQGPTAAGQIGMALSIAGVLGSVASSWVAPRAPYFGALVAQKEFLELDRQFAKLTRVVAGVTLLLAASIGFAVLFLNVATHEIARSLAERIISPLSMACLLGGQCLYLIISVVAVYLRAHKKEPLMRFSVIYGICMGVVLLVMGKTCATLGMTAGYLAVNVVFVPYALYILQRCRREWHS